MEDNQDEQAENSSMRPSDLDWGRLVAPKLGLDITDIQEPKSNFRRVWTIAIVIIVVLWNFASSPLMRMVIIAVGVIAGAGFGLKWIRKAIIKQETRLFSVESGFYWMILGLGGAFIVFLIDRAAAASTLP